MASEAFRRAYAYTSPDRSGRIVAQVFGALAGLLYAGWIVLLVLFTELLLDRGEIDVTGPDAKAAYEVVGETPPVDAPLHFSRRNAGLLPVVVGTREDWYGPTVRFGYDHMPWTHANGPYLSSLVIAAILIGLARVGLLFGQHRAGATVTTRAVNRLQSTIFKHWFDLGSQAFEPGRSSRVTPLLRKAVPEIHAGLEQAIEVQVRERAKVVGLVALAIILNPLLGLCFVIMAILLWIVGSWAVYRVLRRRKELAADSEAQLNRILGLADKLRLIKGYAADDYFQQRYEQHLSRYEQNTHRRLGYQARILMVWQFLGMLLAVMVIILGAQNIVTHRFALSMAAGVYAALISIILPVYLLIMCRQTIRTAGIAAEEVFEFLDQPPSARQREGSRFLQPLTESIEFERVSFRNIFGVKLLDDVSIRIHGGQKVALVGRNPAELRAFVYLLTRFIDPTKGRIRIDGIDIREFTFESLRSQASLVLQGDLLFPDTVANNIGCGDPGFTMPRIVEAAKVAHAHHFVQKLPHGYECLVGEEGFPLKIGESYRIALARAILRDPPIVVIEEPSEAIDEDTKAMLDDTMTRFCRDRTVLVIPRRLSTLKACGQIFLFEAGKLVACGGHRELLETSDLYRHLQYTEFHSSTG